MIVAAIKGLNILWLKIMSQAMALLLVRYSSRQLHISGGKMSRFSSFSTFRFQKRPIGLPIKTQNGMGATQALKGSYQLCAQRNREIPDAKMSGCSNLFAIIIIVYKYKSIYAKICKDFSALSTLRFFDQYHLHSNYSLISSEQNSIQSYKYQSSKNDLQLLNNLSLKSMEKTPQDKVSQILQKVTLQVKPYIDPQGWIRVLTKENQKIALDFKGILTPEHFSNQLKFKDFGVSNSEQTMNTEESWYFQNVKLSGGIVNNLSAYPPTYLDSDIVNINQILANVFNGKTPTGKKWSLEYNEGYLFFGGIIRTYGKWQQFWMGQTESPYIKVGSNTSLRSGGAVHHTGQFIHSSCNGYKEIDHSVTSRWSWNNKRVFWIRL